MGREFYRCAVESEPIGRKIWLADSKFQRHRQCLTQFVILWVETMLFKEGSWELGRQGKTIDSNVWLEYTYYKGRRSMPFYRRFDRIGGFAINTIEEQIKELKLFYEEKQGSWKVS